jgi:hypothetical protein
MDRLESDSVESPKTVRQSGRTEPKTNHLPFNGKMIPFENWEGLGHCSVTLLRSHQLAASLKINFAQQRQSSVLLMSLGRVAADRDRTSFLIEVIADLLEPWSEKSLIAVESLRLFMLFIAIYSLLIRISDLKAKLEREPFRPFGKCLLK